MLTSFGRFVRKMRIDAGYLLKDMADHLGVTASYLSAVEMGKRRIPNDWFDKISIFFSLSPDKKNELMALIQETQRDVQIDLSNTTKQQRDLAFVFARKLDGLNENDIQNIFKVFKKSEKEHTTE
jgi:transcriptional regulator with XRE-family HTH domain